MAEVERGGFFVISPVVLTSIKFSSEVGQISNNYTYLGKSTLQKGHLLNIPFYIREILNIQAGDNLEMQVEGNTIVIKPITELSADNSAKDNIVIFPLPEGAAAVPTVKFPLRKLTGEINKVG